MKLYENYVQILREELIPAMGCTEPIAIAYAAARAREILGAVPDHVRLDVSGNIIKNVKSVVVPNTGGQRGIAAAAAAGIVAGQADKELQVLSEVSEAQKAELAAYLARTPIEVFCAQTPHVLDIAVTLRAGAEEAFVRIAGHHTNILEEKKNGAVIKTGCVSEESLTDRTCLSVEKIVAFAHETDLEAVRPLLEEQIRCNMAIAEEGLAGNWGANIGSTLLSASDDTPTRMRAYAAAASDARMSGCELPVVVCSGSGNQGITASVPVIVYARDKGFSHEQLLRALCVSNLITIHLKTGIGRLSAYCGVVSAGCGAAAGIAFLKCGDLDTVAHTIVNTLATDSGIVCDGAKPSCAAKIASAVDAGLLGLRMYLCGNQFYGGDGLVKKGVENTIRIIGRLASVGMKETDKEIISLMMEE